MPDLVMTLLLLSCGGQIAVVPWKPDILGRPVAKTGLRGTN